MSSPLVTNKKLLPDYSKRRDRLLRGLRSQGAKNLLITSPYNVSYLTGFTGEDSFLWITPKEVVLLSDARYEEQIQSEVKDVELLIRTPSTTIIDAAANALAVRDQAEIWVEAASTSVAQWERLGSRLPNKALASCSGAVERLREIKDAYELNAIQDSIRIAERAFKATTELLEPEMSEKQIADELEFAMRRLGAESAAFKIIVGVGERSALPHGRPSNKPLRDSSFVLIDWGAKKNGYLSDLTRIVLTDKPPANKPSAKLEKMYRAVLQAQMDAIAAIKPGVLMSQIDAVARKALEKAGLEKRFTHGLGHSFGLEIHESVRLGKGQERPLEAGMVVTVEPGVYIPGFGGVRIEDDVLVTDSGNQVLTSLAKQWDEVLGA
ncbi:MAG: aminopeptidase P family protein [Planctomycetota bacterium]|nr:MAG: aminopeptidase P family protein [Planctomycetota bacterium]